MSPMQVLEHEPTKTNETKLKLKLLSNTTQFVFFFLFLDFGRCGFSHEDTPEAQEAYRRNPRIQLRTFLHLTRSDRIVVHKEAKKAIPETRSGNNKEKKVLELRYRDNAVISTTGERYSIAPTRRAQKLAPLRPCNMRATSAANEKKKFVRPQKVTTEAPASMWK
eukprot:c13811_g1_i1.p2 GENE.c13811_g1_i1~~c13811_g1_i1.p2  ORF type:complete len:165 (+),score=37.16 c13811_g1_i1:390-884(+)